MPNAMTTPSLERGSEWRKWDLHIHSPKSALNNQFPFLADGTPDWEQYLRRLESLTDIPVVAITDYFSIDGYRKVLEFREQGRLQNIGLILPNIEFRLDKIVGTNKGPRRLNYHVIFSDAVSPDAIEEHFLQELKFCYEGDPQHADSHLSVRRINVEHMGARLKAQHEPFRDRSDFEIGCTNATVDPNEIKKVLENKGSIFKGKYLIILAEEHLGLLDWNGQDHLTRKLLVSGAHSIFSANPRTIAWTRGEGDLSPEQFRSEFKTLKPCLHGSDAHRLEDIGKPAADRYCWIKADTSFEGLKEVLYEPKERLFIGDQPPQLKHNFQIIESVRVSNVPGWFEDAPIPLNRDLVAIIGPRGSGKSALAEVVAFAGGASLFRAPNETRAPSDISDTFLSKASKRSPANKSPIVGASVALTWVDGTSETVTIPQTLRHARQDEKVKYLPQKFVERLCAPENNRQLEEEIERVIFQRIDKTDRRDASDFQELRQASTGSIAIRRERLTRTIQSLNQSIADAQGRILLRPSKENELKTKRTDLAALLKNVPQIPQENKAELDRLDLLVREKQKFERQIIGIAEQISAIGAIESKYEVLRQDLAAFNEEVSVLLSRVGLQEQRNAFLVGVPQGLKDILNAKRAVLNAETDKIRVGAEDQPRHLAIINKEIEEIKTRSQLTEARRKEYDKFQKDRQQLEEFIASLEREIKEITEVVIPRAKVDSEAREDRYVDALELLKEERAVLQRLYKPLRDALASSDEVARKLNFISRLTFAFASHASKGMELLDRRKALYRDQDELEQALKTYFDNTGNADFDRQQVKAALHALRESFVKQEGRTVKIDDQLRTGRTAKEFADWFYSTDPFAISYSIEFDGKDLQLLSPGEKGIVLLLLYLEAESEDNRPLIVDQPDDNLDNVSVYPSLIQYFRSRKRTRQVIIITHNPNLVVNTDAEQVFVADFDGSRNPKIEYRSGSLENTNPVGPKFGIRENVCSILEGGTEAFRLREQRYALS